MPIRYGPSFFQIYNIIPYLRKEGILDLLVELQHGVAGSGRQVKNVLKRLVNLQDDTAAQGLTSPAEPASATPPPGCSSPRRDDEHLSKGVGLGISNVNTPCGPTEAPAAYLENARNALKASIMASRQHQPPPLARSDSLPQADGTDRKHPRDGTSASTPQAQQGKRVRIDDSGAMNKAAQAPGTPKFRDMEKVLHIASALGPNVAGEIKCLVKWAAADSDDPKFEEVVENELSALRRIRKIPGLACLDGVGDAGVERYIFMRYTGSISLRDRLTHGGPFDLRTTAFQMARLIHAVHMMHLRGVVHCNINLDSIVVGEGGDFGLFDFGSSVLLDKEPEMDGDVPLWPDGDTNFAFNQCPPYQVFEGDRCAYYIDYVALAQVWHEIRTFISPLALSATSGGGLTRLEERLLLPDETHFLRSLLCRTDGRWFRSVTEMKAHCVFKNIDWKQFD